MIDFDVTFVIQLVNFLITMVVLHFLLVQPVRNILAKRSATMDGLVAETERFAADAEAKLKNYEAVIAEARAQATAERETVKAAASEEEKAIVVSATEEAQGYLAKAREEVAGQMNTAMDTLRSQVDALAEKAAGKVLG